MVGIDPSLKPMSTRNSDGSRAPAHALSSNQATDIRQWIETCYQARSPQAFYRGEAIPLLEQQIWVVDKGMVVLGTVYPDGTESIFGFVGPSGSFGLPLTVVAPYQAKALTSTQLMRFSLAEVECSPALLTALLPGALQRLRQTEAMLMLVGQRQVEDRLRQFLLLLKQEVGQPTSEGIRLNIRLTHQQIASILGTTRVTVTRILGELKRQGWLHTDRHHMILSPQTETFASNVCHAR